MPVDHRLAGRPSIAFVAGLLAAELDADAIQFRGSHEPIMALGGKLPSSKDVGSIGVSATTDASLSPASSPVATSSGPPSRELPAVPAAPPLPPAPEVPPVGIPALPAEPARPPDPAEPPAEAPSWDGWTGVVGSSLQAAATNALERPKTTATFFFITCFELLQG